MAERKLIDLLEISISSMYTCLRMIIYKNEFQVNCTICTCLTELYKFKYSAVIFLPLKYLCWEYSYSKEMIFLF